MFKNFILVKDKVFSKKECKDIIKTYSKNCSKSEHHYLGYDFYDIEIFNYINKLAPIIDEYKKIFKGLDMTRSKWKLGDFRFKHFKPGKHFAGWHSEHALSYSYRILNIQIYLSTHNCGTQFLDYETIKSNSGRVALFPSYFTHTHKGQVCPENKDRYIITAYLSFYEKGKNE
jgi:hypothetical protein